MHAGAEQWMPVLAERGTVLALVALTLMLVGMLAAGFGGLASRVSV